MNNKIALKPLIPHIFHANWKVDEKKIKEYIQKFGYWAWEQSKPVLKIIMNDINILGEQDCFFINLLEGERECVFYVANNNKVYKTEYGRMLENEIFITLVSSNSVIIAKNSYEAIYRLPDILLQLSDIKR